MGIKSSWTLSRHSHILFKLDVVRRWVTGDYDTPILYQTAVWCIWRDFLSHSFATTFRLWKPEAAVTSFRDVVRRQILADRAACLSVRHQNWQMNPEEFEKRWGQSPPKVSSIRGPDCLLRPQQDPEGDHKSEWKTVDGENSSITGTQV